MAEAVVMVGSRIYGPGDVIEYYAQKIRGIIQHIERKVDLLKDPSPNYIKALNRALYNHNVNGAKDAANWRTVLGVMWHFTQLEVTLDKKNALRYQAISRDLEELIRLLGELELILD